MTDPFEELKEAERKRTFAENAVTNLKSQIEEMKVKFHKALHVGKNKPCAVAILPNDKVAVCLHTDDDKPNQLHFVTPLYLDENAQPRKQSAEELKGEERCTGISAVWCPIHGECTCEERGDLNDDDCPLHSFTSTHGE